MTPPTSLYHAFLRPCVLQTLRATGYYGTRPATIETLTEMAAQYLSVLCAATARHAQDNTDDVEESLQQSGVSIVDVRMALEEVGALGVVERFVEPEGQQRGGQQQQGQPKSQETQSQNKDNHEASGHEHNGDDGTNGVTNEGQQNELSARDLAWTRNGDDDIRGVVEFTEWFKSARCRAIRYMVMAGIGDTVVGAGLENEVQSTDYLHALMSKHSKSAEESKFHGTILGKGNDSNNEVLVEGGDLPSIKSWEQSLMGPPVLTPPPSSPAASGSRPPSSGLSSVGDRLGEEGDSMMELS